MPRRSQPQISARKQPKQARAAGLVADILEAAIRVLKRDGAPGFTTVRVAQEAGVSVGSLYQYFPNKEALLFKLQADEWEDTAALLWEMLADPSIEPLARLRRVVTTFFRSEQQEAELRGALDEAGALFRSSPEARRLQVKTRRHLTEFVRQAVPHASKAEAALIAEVVGNSLWTSAEAVTTQTRARSAIDAYADAMADMYCAYLREFELRCQSRARAAKPRA
ncbi:MAG TPA: TetR family transcriptional regulator [Polyangiaceae bacterium]|nr:TetR family transcriptional regulator [Polyangiaceae bacterium]